MEDFSNENKKKIEKLNFEIKILNNQLEEHKKCLNERELLNREYSELKKNLQEIKNIQSKINYFIPKDENSVIFLCKLS